MSEGRLRNNGHLNRAHRDAAKEARSVANQMAVNCRSQIGRIEGIKGWQKDKVLNHWIEAFQVVLTTLTKPTPSPWVRPLGWTPDEDQPVEAPPDGVAVLPAVNGSAGSGSGKTDGGVSGAPPTSVEEDIDWEEIYGRQ